MAPFFVSPGSEAEARFQGGDLHVILQTRGAKFKSSLGRFRNLDRPSGRGSAHGCSLEARLACSGFEAAARAAIALVRMPRLARYSSTLAWNSACEGCKTVAERARCRTTASIASIA